MGFAAYYGVLFQSVCFSGMSRYQQPQKGWKMMLRTLLSLVMVVPFLAMTCIDHEMIPNLYVLALFKSMLPLVCVGFCLFGVLDEFNLKIKLYDEKKQSCFELPLLPNELS